MGTGAIFHGHLRVWVSFCSFLIVFFIYMFVHVDIGHTCGDVLGGKKWAPGLQEPELEVVVSHPI